jgi:multiple sugar transport system substrate-binding protein
MKKFLCIATAALIAISALTGCAGNKNSSSSAASEDANAKAELTFMWWGNQVRNDRTQKVIQLYEEKNPNVTITPQMVDWASYWNKLATQAAANSAPDIIQQDYSQIDSYASKNLLLDMTPYTKNGVFDTTNIAKDIIASGTIKNKFIAISIGSNVLDLIYDPAVLTKAGLPAISNNWTWDDFDTTVENVYKKTGLPADELFPTGSTLLIEYAAREAGGSLYSKDGKSLGFKDVKCIQSGYERLLTHVKDGSFVSPDKMAAATQIELDPLVSGKSWLSSCWSNQYVAYATAAKRTLTLINLPINKDAKKMGLYNKPGQFLSVSANTKYKTASMKFVNFFENTTDANYILLGERGVPTNSKVAEAVKAKVDTNTAVQFEYVNLMNSKKLVSPVDPPNPSSATQIGTLEKGFYDKVAYQKESPAQAAADFFKQANDLMSSAS